MVQNSETEHVRKRRKVGHSPELGSVGKKLASYKDGTFGCTSTSQGYNFEPEGRKKLRDAQRSLHLSLKPEIAKLCKILKFSDNAQCIAEEFLEYVMNNHDFRTESTTILQALQISLCRTVASMLKQKIDHREFLVLAKQHLNFNCSKDEADFAYSIVRCLKGMLSYQTGKLEVADFPRVPVLSVSDSLRDYIHGTHSPSSNDQRFLSQSELALEIKVAQDNVSKSIKRIQKKFQKKLNKLTQKHQEVKNGLVHSFEADKAHIEERKKMENVVIGSCLENTSMREDKLKLVDFSFAKEFEELERQKDTRLKKLEAEHLLARRKIQDKKARWVDAVKSWVACDELLGKRPSSEPDDNAGEVILRFPRTNSSNDGANNIAHVDLNPASPKEQICNGLTVNESEKEVQLGVPETIVSSDGQENLDLADGPLSEVQIPVTTAVSSPVNEMQLRVPENVSSGDDDTVDSVTQVSLVDTAKLNEPSGENTLLVPEISCDEVEVSQTSEENDETRTVASNIATGRNQQDVVDNAVDPNSLLQELSQVNSSCVQRAISMTDGDPMSANQAHEDGRTVPSVSRGMQLGDIPTSNEQNATEEVEQSVSPPVETVPTNQSDREAMVSEPTAQVHLSQPSNSTSCCNTADVPIVGEVANLLNSEGCTFNRATELVNPPLMLNQPVSQPSTSSLNQPFDIPIGASRMHFPELRTAVASEFNNRPAQTIPAVPLVPSPEYDLLGKELERLGKEFDQNCKGFEYKKLHLKAECDREIAQILLKYEIKQQEVDAECLTKRKEFHNNYYKVWMNKFLADAFRIKHMELTTSGRSGTLQDENVSDTQQMIELSLPQNAQRPLIVASTSAASTPAPSLQTLALEPQTTISALTISPQNTPPHPVQYVSPPSALFPNAIARPPQIISFSSANGNLQGGPQIRALVPHLQSSAPINLVASTSAASTPTPSLQTLALEPQTTISALTICPQNTPPHPVQYVSPPSALFPNAIARPPQIISFSSANGNLQGGPQIRALVPHLQSSAPINLVASTSAANTPAISLQTLAHEPQTTISAPIISPQSTPPPPVQYASPPSALLPSANARPTQISPLSSANGNLQGGPHIRAQAPHVQSLAPTNLVANKSAASTPTASLQTLAHEPQTTISAPTISPQSTPPPTVQYVSPPSVLLPSANAGPPQISSLSSANGNLHGGPQIRAQPPHLRSLAPTKLVANKSAASTPTASLQTLAHEPQTTISAPTISPQSTPPPAVQYVSPPSALLPSANARPPQSSSLSSANGNLQGGPRICAQPPHLQSSTPTNLVANKSAASTATASLQTLAHEPQTTTSAPTISPQSTPPPPVSSPSALFPSANAGPPQISSLSSANGNLQGGPQIRALVPHLQSSAPTNLVASTSAANTLTASLQTLPHEPQTTTSAPIISPHSKPPSPVQYVSRPPPLSPSGTARPPQISSLPSANGNLESGSQIRAQAPHLQSSAPTTSLPPHPNRRSSPMNAPTVQSNTLPCVGGPQIRVKAQHLRSSAPTTILPLHQHRMRTMSPTNAPTMPKTLPLPLRPHRTSTPPPKKVPTLRSIEVSFLPIRPGPFRPKESSGQAGQVNEKGSSIWPKACMSLGPGRLTYL